MSVLALQDPNSQLSELFQVTSSKKPQQICTNKSTATPPRAAPPLCQMMMKSWTQLHNVDARFALYRNPEDQIPAQDFIPACPEGCDSLHS